MSASPTRAPSEARSGLSSTQIRSASPVNGPRSSGPTDAPRHEQAVFEFKGFQAGIEEFALRYDDHIVAAGDLVTAKYLSYQSLSAIAPYRAAQFLRRGDPQAARFAAVRQEKQRAVTSVDAEAAVVNLLKIRAAPNPFVRPELLQFQTCSACRSQKPAPQAIPTRC